MAFASLQKKPGEENWFIHAPSKRAEPQEQGQAPISQVPYLNGDYSEEVPQSNSMRGRIKDTDTAYIRLAKQGGQHDLLYMPEAHAASKEPVAYPRVDWFYHEDTSRDPKAEHQFTLPDYMVHEQFNPAGEPQQTAAPAEHAAPATHRAPHFGAAAIEKKYPPGQKRNMKKQEPVEYHLPAVVRHVARIPKKDERFERMPTPTYEKEPVNMGTLLSMGYAREWKEYSDDWHGHHPATGEPKEYQYESPEVETRRGGKRKVVTRK